MFYLVKYYSVFIYFISHATKIGLKTRQHYSWWSPSGSVAQCNYLQCCMQQHEALYSAWALCCHLWIPCCWDPLTCRLHVTTQSIVQCSNTSELQSRKCCHPWIPRCWDHQTCRQFCMQQHKTLPCLHFIVLCNASIQVRTTTQQKENLPKRSHIKGEAMQDTWGAS